jgi:hypothetical protein
LGLGVGVGVGGRGRGRVRVRVRGQGSGFGSGVEFGFGFELGLGRDVRTPRVTFMADDLGCHPAVGACLGCEHPAQLRVVGGLDGDTKVCELDTARVVEEHVGALDLGVGVGVGARDRG